MERRYVSYYATVNHRSQITVVNSTQSDELNVTCGSRSMFV